MINLVAVETRQEQAAGATTTSKADLKGKIVEMAWDLKKKGRSQATIGVYSRFLTALLDRGADLNDPDSVKDVISQQEHWAKSTKNQAVTAYTAFCLKHGLKWEPPTYEPQRKLPFIPLEKELDSLIASCGKKTSTILQTLKETGARIGEALALKWTDVDSEHCTISINSPEKNSNSGIYKASHKLIDMLNALPKQNEYVFKGISPQNIAANFRLQRKRAAAKLQNPRLLQIHFHTFRHWKATTEYARTKDILHVMQILRHKNIQNTLLYTQLIVFENDEYHSAIAKSTTEAQKLIEVGFEYVCSFDNVMLFRKRK